MLVYASALEDHAKYRKINLMEAKVEQMKEKVSETMVVDPTLEPATIVDKVLNDLKKWMAIQRMNCWQSSTGARESLILVKDSYSLKSIYSFHMI